MTTTALIAIAMFAVGFCGALGWTYSSPPKSFVADPQKTRVPVSHIRLKWAGRTLDDAAFWIGDEPVGKGRHGYLNVVRHVCLVDNHGFITVLVSRDDFLAYEREHQVIEVLPFANDRVERDFFSRVLGIKGMTIGYESAKLVPEK